MYPLHLHPAALIARQPARPAREVMGELMADMRLKQMRRAYGTRLIEVAILLLAAVCAGGAVALAVL